MANQTGIGVYRDYVSGVEAKAPLLDGSQRTYINFDNAASTPAFISVQDAVNEFLPYYSSVHRGTGFKSQLSTHAYEQARKAVLRFLSADEDTYTCIFTKNATEALNLLAHRIRIGAGRNVVLISGMEHHSNDLPWRWAAEVYHVALTPDGRLDEEDFDRKLEIFGKRVALVSISGASNVTGWINPIHRLAEKVHAIGGQIAIDVAQLAPHRKIEMLPLDDPAHLDYVAFSAHKMYAPFGSGVLVGRKDTFSEGNPFMRGGGEVDIVTLDHVVWSSPPERDEAGSPNTIGAVALAAAIRQLEAIGMDTVARHEADLTAYALRRLQEVSGVIIYGDTDPQNAPHRLGVIPINLEGLSHYLVAAVLGYEYGIGVRNGCFCAHPYLLHLMGVSQEEAYEVRDHILANDRTQTPGMVRISFGIYNTFEEIDVLVEALDTIRKGKYRGIYQQDRASGDYLPSGNQTKLTDYFKL